MELKDHIGDIRTQLKDEVFSDEEAVRTHIVLRLLEPLKWPRFKPQIIQREYPIKRLKVDFALCHPASKPIIFIEAKKVGNINENGEEQLFQYAFNQGVPIVVLTDGREWRFYYPRGDGDIRDRLVYKVDMLETSIETCAICLNRYLNYEEIGNGNAIRAVKDDYALRQVQKAWDALLVEADPSWIDVIVNKTENLCRYRPTAEQVLTFLKKMGREGVHPSIEKEEPTSNEPEPTSNEPEPTSNEPESYFVVKFLDNNITVTGKTIIESYAKAIDKLVNDCGIEQVIQADKDYVDQVSYRKLRHISTSKEEVDHPPAYKARKSEAGNYYISTYSYTDQKKAYLEEIANDLLSVRLKVVYQQ